MTATGLLSQQSRERWNSCCGSKIIQGMGSQKDSENIKIMVYQDGSQWKEYVNLRKKCIKV